MVLALHPWEADHGVQQTENLWLPLTEHQYLVAACQGNYQARGECEHEIVLHLLPGQCGPQQLLWQDLPEALAAFEQLK